MSQLTTGSESTAEVEGCPLRSMDAMAGEGAMRGARRLVLVALGWISVEVGRAPR